jgi:hypothetical protein
VFIFRFIITILLVANLASCGGGSSSDSPKNQSADGYWSGYSTESDGSVYEIFFLSSDEKYIAFDSDFDIIISGSLSISGDQLTSTNSRSYDTESSEYLIDGITVDGTVNSKSKIIAELKQNDYAITSNIKLDYDALWEEKISYSDLEGSWDFLDEDGSYYPVEVTTRGYFEAENDGCFFSGNVEIPNNSQSIISTEFNVKGGENCLEGNYTGLGLLNDNELIVIGTNNQFAVGIYAKRPN